MHVLREGESFKPGTSMATLAAQKHSRTSFQERLARMPLDANDFVRSRSRTGELVVSFKARVGARRVLVLFLLLLLLRRGTLSCHGRLNNPLIAVRGTEQRAAAAARA